MNSGLRSDACQKADEQSVTKINKLIQASEAKLKEVQYEIAI
jgi:hypothetical protein